MVDSVGVEGGGMTVEALELQETIATKKLEAEVDINGDGAADKVLVHTKTVTAGPDWMKGQTSFDAVKYFGEGNPEIARFQEKYGSTTVTFGQTAVTSYSVTLSEDGSPHYWRNTANGTDYPVGLALYTAPKESCSERPSVSLETPWSQTMTEEAAIAYLQKGNVSCDNGTTYQLAADLGKTLHYADPADSMVSWSANVYATEATISTVDYQMAGGGAVWVDGQP